MVTSLCPKVQKRFSKVLKQSLGWNFFSWRYCACYVIIIEYIWIFKSMQICIISRNDHNNFKSHQIMLTFLGFTIFFRFHVHYTPFTCGKDSWNLEILKKNWISKIFKFHIFWIVCWLIGYYYWNFLP
jgi:hypothetical protein